MRIAVISDIHANYIALSNCMNHIKKVGIDKIICLGDIVGYYYDPDKCLDLLLDNNVECIKGNHESMLLEILDNPNKLDEYIKIYGNGIKIAYEKLNKYHLSFIKNLPEKKNFIFEKINVLIAHGSPWNNNFYIYPNSKDEIYKKLEEYNKSYIFLGHTHHQMFKKVYNTTVVNPGSVGQPRDIGNEAKWLLFETKKNKITFFKTPFDTEDLIRKINLYDANKSILTNFLKK